MKLKFRLYQRDNGIYYVHDNETGKQESLKTRDRATALNLFQAKNQSHEQPILNLHMARTYLAGSDPEVASRTWQKAMNAIVETKEGATKERWLRAVKDHALDLIRNLPILETRSEHFLKALNQGTVSTNVHLRKLHNFALDLSWLPWPVLPKRQWPKIRYGEKRAITWEEHRKIVKVETNPERRSFYELAWHLGASQTDLVSLHAEDIDWNDRTIGFARKKTHTPALPRFSDCVAEILRSLPASGPLFPNFKELNAGHRATEFKRACRRAGIEGVTLHSYRYAWAERAKQCGYPERFAQEALGHNSKAVHRAYAKKAKVLLPPLDEYEKKVIPLHPTGVTAEKKVAI